MKKIVITDKIDFSKDQKERLKSLGIVKIFEDLPVREDEIIRRIKGANIITSNWVKISENIIKSNPTLDNIVVSAIGYDNIDIKIAKENHIIVSNSPKYCVNAVAEHTICLILALARKLVKANINMKNGICDKEPLLGIELLNKKLCIIGKGKIGTRVGEIASGFGMKVEFINSKSSKIEIKEKISKSNFVSLHLPLNENTFHYFDVNKFRYMRKDSYLINTSRGKIVDTNILINYLKNYKIAGAGIDVYETPFMSTKLPNELKELVSLENVITTPHIAFNTKEAIYNIAEEVIENIQAILYGKPINVVN